MGMSLGSDQSSRKRKQLEKYQGWCSQTTLDWGWLRNTINVTVVGAGFVCVHKRLYLVNRQSSVNIQVHSQSVRLGFPCQEFLIWSVCECKSEALLNVSSVLK